MSEIERKKAASAMAKARWNNKPPYFTCPVCDMQCQTVRDWFRHLKTSAACKRSPGRPLGESPKRPPSPHAQSVAKFRAKNPEKLKAAQIVNYAVSKGQLTRPEECTICGSTRGGTLHGHHEDHGRPLDVIWCCVTCHRRIHAAAQRRAREAKPKINKRSIAQTERWKKVPARKKRALGKKAAAVRWATKPALLCPVCGSQQRSIRALAAHRRSSAPCKGKRGRPRKNTLK